MQITTTKFKLIKYSNNNKQLIYRIYVPILKN